MKKTQKIRTFLTAFMLTLCLLLFAVGASEVDYQSRRIGFGDGGTLSVQLIGRDIHPLSQNFPVLDKAVQTFMQTVKIKK